MKARNLFYLLLALPLFFAGCTEGENIESAAEGTKLTLTSEDSLQFTADGGNGTIAYTLQNGVAGINLEATCEAQWVSNITIGEEITFTVAANEGDARNTKIVVSYAQLSFEVGVAQAGKSGSDTPAENVTLTAQYLIGNYWAKSWGSVDYNYTIILSDVGLDEEGEYFPNGKYYYIEVYSTEAIIDEDNYITVPSGTYTYDISNSTKAGTMGAGSFYMEMNSDASDYIIGLFESATLVVTENSSTLNAVIEGVEHTVTYNSALKIPIVDSGDDGGDDGGEDDDEDLSGNITDANFTALDAYAEYYGDEYSPNTADNFYLILSDLGFDEDGYEYADGSYYCFDLYTPITADMTIAPGTYTIDDFDTCEPWTVSTYYSSYYKMDEFGYGFVAEDYPVSGYITINEDGSIYADIQLANSGATHKISFDGDIYIYDAREGLGDGSSDMLTTLTGDYTCLFNNHTLYYTPYGDYYEIGLDNYIFTLIPDDYEGDIVTFEVLTNSNDFTGAYYISDSMDANTAYPGGIEYDYYMVGAWYYTGDYENMAALVEGDIEVTKNSDNTYTLTFETYDELGNCVNGSWTGYAEEYIDSYAASKATKLSKSLVVEQKAATAKTSKKQNAKQNVKSSVVAKGIKLR